MGNAELSASGALARITYHDGSQGLLLYLKPWRPKYMRADVFAYSAEHEKFPHESTADQFFGERQFESYRALGEQIVTQAFAGSELFMVNWLQRIFEQVQITARAAQKDAQPLTPTQAMPPGWKGPPPHPE